MPAGDAVGEEVRVDFTVFGPEVCEDLAKGRAVEYSGLLTD
jgi:hypothetical protein